MNCKKKELCLLEDAFTAVCVSKKELHKNRWIINFTCNFNFSNNFVLYQRDEIVDKTKYLEAEAERTADLDDSDEFQMQSDADEEDASNDDILYGSEDNELDEEYVYFLRYLCIFRTIKHLKPTTFSVIANHVQWLNQYSCVDQTIVHILHCAA